MDRSPSRASRTIITGESRHARRPAPLLAIALLLAAPGIVGAHDGSHQVTVEDNRFDPETRQVDPGETVTWTIVGAGPHTITADDGSFDSGALARLDSFERAFPDVGFVAYHCRIHASMRGVIVVGDPPHPPPPPPPPQRRVPADYPTIGEALEGIRPGTVVLIEPGVYPESVVLTVGDVTLRGQGADPSDVVLDGAGRSAGIFVAADGVAIENITVRGYGEWGVAFDDASDFVVERVHAIDNGENGLRFTGARGGSVRDVVASGSGEAGIAVRGCRDCDLLVVRAQASGNSIGYLGLNAGAVSILDSTFSGNDIGLVLGTAATEEDPPQRGTHVWGSLVGGNNGAGPAHRGFAASIPLPRGVGVWIAGGWFDVIEANRIEHHDVYGVVASAFGTPARAGRIAGNVVSASGRADLAWDGIGDATCFEGNRTQDGAEPTSAPGGVQTLYPCARPVVGVPYPLVQSELLLSSTERS